jgi:hypothetical protein
LFKEKNEKTQTNKKTVTLKCKYREEIKLENSRNKKELKSKER